MKWLHLSDIHFADLGFDTEVLRNSLLSKLKELSLNLDFIIITGDCFYKNNASKDIIPELKKFIKAVSDICHVDKGRVCICPGNHDLNRNDDDRNRIIEDARKKGTLSNDIYLSLVGRANDNFRSLFREVKKKEYKDYDVIDHKNLDVRIITINSCLLSKDDSDYQTLRVCTPALEQLADKIKEDGKLNIMMMHHGIDWLATDDAKKFEHWIEDHGVDAIFVGHTHQPKVTALNDVERVIFQFTSGAMMMDGHAIPSFFICEENGGMLSVTLFSYFDKTGSWGVDNHSLRQFRKNGKRTFYLQKRIEVSDIINVPNISLSELSCEELVKDLNNKYSDKFGTRRFYSNKTSEYEDFNAWKIVGSLAEIGMPYPIALRIAIQVVEYITDEKYPSVSVVNSDTLKQIIQDSILTCHEVYPEVNEYDIGIWVNKYSRHYSKDIGFVMIEGDRETSISYNLLKTSVLKDIIIDLTGNEVFYKKISTSDLERMSSNIMRFIKSLSIAKIKKNILYDVIAEYISEPPHSWFVTNNKELIFDYHKKESDRYLKILEKKEQGNPVLQIGAAYHVFAAYLTIYDKFIGCSDTAPITIVKNSLAQIGSKTNENLPMRRCMLIQLKEDLEANGVQFESFKKQVEVVYKHIVEEKDVTNEDTVMALIFLREMLKNIEKREVEEWVNTGNAFSDVVGLFKNALGFIVRDPIQMFSKQAFVVAPYWDDHQKRKYNLGDDMLVCMLDNKKVNIGKLCEYLKQKRKRIIQEIVLFKEDISSFTSDERIQIRSRLKENNINVRCVFIQEKNFGDIKSAGWREVFFDIVGASRNSIW